MRESDAGNSNTVGEKLCKHKYSTTYPYCYGEIATETQGNFTQDANSSLYLTDCIEIYLKQVHLNMLHMIVYLPLDRGFGY